MSSAAAAAQSARHGRVVQILVNFAAVLLVLVSLWLLRLVKDKESQSGPAGSVFPLIIKWNFLLSPSQVGFVH